MSEEILLDSAGKALPHPMDSSDEEFNSWLSTARIGDVQSIHNLLCQGFNQMKEIKDELLIKVKNEPNEESREVLKSMYPMLLRIETRIFKCRDRVREIQEIPMT